jgi:hypothetical protein
MMQTPNVLETPVYPNLPECENGSVGSISRHEVDAAWLAGIIDGEGCIHTTYANGKKSKNHYRCRVEVRNTDPFMIQRITQILANSQIQFFLQFVKYEGKWKDQLVVVVTGYKAIQSLLKMVLPHLTAKQKEAQLMAEFINWRLNAHPMIGCNNGKNMEVLREKYLELHHGLRMVKRRSFGFQRLPRGGSCTLDLSKLEVHEAVV